MSVDYLRKQNRAGHIGFKRLAKKYVVTEEELDRYVKELPIAVPPRRR